MPKAFEPTNIEPFDIEPGWIEPGRGHYCLYRGLGSAKAIDYAEPVAVVSEEEAEVTLVLALEGGERHYLAARAVSAGGTEEQNTHIVCCVQVDQDGNLLAPPLARPADLTAELLPCRTVAIAFSYDPPAGYAAAESFEVLSDRGTGQLDMVTPVAVVSACPGGEYQVAIAAEVLPARFAVRARGGDRIGPISAAVFVQGGAPLAPRILVQAGNG